MVRLLNRPDNWGCQHINPQHQVPYSAASDEDVFQVRYSAILHVDVTGLRIKQQV